MSTTVLFEVDGRHESILRRALAMVQEMENLALTAPDGVVFDVCKEAVIHKGRDLQRQMLADAVALRIEAAEKGTPIRACPCGRQKDNRGPRRRALVSAVGAIAFSRRYWKCACGADGSYAADELLKARGARWCSRNVLPMASLVCVRHSSQWEAYWAVAT